jgi:hypothetical protein
MIKSRRMRLAGHVACIGEMRNSHKLVVREAEGKRLRWEDNIKIDLKTGYELDASGPEQGPVAGSYERRNDPNKQIAWSRVLLEKLRVTQLVKKFPAFK